MISNVSAITNNPQLNQGQRVNPSPQIRQEEKPRPAIDMHKVIAELTDVSAAFSKRLSFRLNEKLDQIVVKVIDTDTDTVIREIPPAELQHVHERIREVMGILFDERA